MNDILIQNKIASLPEELKSEVEDFIDFLLTKRDRLKEAKPVFGSGKGMFIMKPDFDKPLEDFKDYYPNA